MGLRSIQRWFGAVKAGAGIAGVSATCFPPNDVRRTMSAERSSNKSPHRPRPAQRRCGGGHGRVRGGGRGRGRWTDAGRPGLCALARTASCGEPSSRRPEPQAWLARHRQQRAAPIRRRLQAVIGRLTSIPGRRADAWHRLGSRSGLAGCGRGPLALAAGHRREQPFCSSSRRALVAFRGAWRLRLAGSQRFNKKAGPQRRPAWRSVSASSTLAVRLASGHPCRPGRIGAGFRPPDGGACGWPRKGPGRSMPTWRVPALGSLRRR